MYCHDDCASKKWYFVTSVVSHIDPDGVEILSCDRLVIDIVIHCTDIFPQFPLSVKMGRGGSLVCHAASSCTISPNETQRFVDGDTPGVRLC